MPPPAPRDPLSVYGARGRRGGGGGELTGSADDPYGSNQYGAFGRSGSPSRGMPDRYSPDMYSHHHPHRQSDRSRSPPSSSKGSVSGPAGTHTTFNMGAADRKKSIGEDDADDDDDDEAEEESSGRRRKVVEDNGDYAPFSDEEWMFPPTVLEKNFLDKNGQIIATQTRAGVLKGMLEEKKRFETMSSYGRSSHEGQYCYRCEQRKTTNLNGKNEYVDHIDELLNDIQSKSIYLVCNQVWSYYNVTVLPKTGKVWEFQAIYDHIHDHQINPLALVMANIRYCTRVKKEYQKVGRNRNGLPNKDAVITCMRVINQMEKSIKTFVWLSNNPQLIRKNNHG